MDVGSLTLATLSEDDLVALNQRLVERLQLPALREEPRRTRHLNGRNDREIRNGRKPTISEPLARLNQRIARVVCASGPWPVSPSLLRAAAASRNTVM